jgi:uncharacterized protein YndB with AHSA1/START domain
MVEIILENLRYTFTSTNSNDFRMPNLSFSNEDGTVTFHGRVLKVRNPEKVYDYLHDKRIHTDSKSRITIFFRITPKGRVMVNEYRWKNSFFKSADKFLQGGMLERRYQFLVYDNDAYEEDDLRFVPYRS